MFNFEFLSLQEASSPLQHSQENIKAYFQNLKTINAQQNKLPDFDFGFEPKISPKNCCTEVLKPNDKYYFCQNCLNNSFSNDKMIFCSGCFDPSRHEGHQFVEKTVKLYTRVSCDCGRISRVKKQSFCDSHNPTINKLEGNIQEDKSFTSTFHQLFQILFFLEQNEKEERTNLFRQLIVSNLINLSKNSLYYARQIQILFEQNIKIGENTVLLKKEILKTAEYQDLILQLLGDSQYLLKFGRFFCQLQMSGEMLLFQFGIVKKQLFSSYDFIRNLKPSEVDYYSSEDLINTKISQILNTSEGDKTKSLESLFKMIHNSTTPRIITKIVQKGENILRTDENLAHFLFEKILDLGIEQLQTKENQSPVKFERSIRRIPNGNPFREQRMREQEQRRRRQNRIRISPQNIVSLFKIIVKIIFLKSDKTFQGLKQTAKNFIFESRVEEKALIFLDILTKNKALQMYSIGSERNLKALAVLTIFYSFDRREKSAISSFWETNFKRKFSDILRISNNLFNGLIDLYKLFPSFAYSSEQFLNLSEDEKTKRVFKSWLAHKGTIRREQLLEEFLKGWIPMNCLDSVSQSCNVTAGNRNVNHNLDSILTSKKTLKAQEKDIILLLSTMQNNWDLLSIELGESSSQINQNLKQILRFFFDYKELAPFFEKFNQFLETPSNDKNDIIVEYFSFLSKLEKVAGLEEIQKVFQKIKTTENVVKKVIENTQEHRNIFRKLLKVSNEEGESMIDQEMIDCEKERKIIQEKCKSMKQKLRKAWNVADEPTSIGVLDENDQTNCILCKGVAKKENHFIYLANVAKNNVISQRIHGKSSLSSTYFKSQLHAMHIQCYKNQTKNNLGFRCVHCNQYVNCVLPYKISTSEIFKKDFLFCQRVVQGALMCQFNDFSSNLFEIIFDSLLESLGIVEIIFSNRHNVMEKRKTQKDRYLLVILTSVYQEAQQDQLKSFKQVFQKYLKRLETTEESDKIELKLFQKVIIKTLIQAIKRESFDQEDLPNLINQLKMILFENEFAVLQDKLNFIRNFNNQCSTQQQKQEQESKPKINQTNGPIQQKKSLKFNILQLPQSLNDLQELNFEKLNQQLPSRNCPCGGSSTEKIKSICLLCKKVFCALCQDDEEHRRSHQNLRLDIQIETGRLQYLVPGAGRPQRKYCYLNQLFFSSEEMSREARNDTESRESKQIMEQLTDRKNFKFNENPVQHFESLLFGLNRQRQGYPYRFRNQFMNQAFGEDEFDQ